MSGKNKKRLGQHFLINRHLAQYMGSLGAGKVLEIGSGKGSITKFINAERIYAVEYDRELCPMLKEDFPDAEVICGDFLKVKPFPVDIIIGSIPYYISSPIIFRLVDWEFNEAYLVIQYEFAKKMVAKPGDKNYGRLSVTAQLCFDVTLMKKISRDSFSPPPKVDSALIKLTKKGKISRELEELIRILFSHKNKKVSATLKGKNYIVPEEIKEKRPRHMGIEEIKKIRVV